MKNFSARTLFLFLNFIFALSAKESAAVEAPELTRLIEKARNQDLASDSQWLGLLHYRHGLLGNFRSQVKGTNFFLSPDGRSDAKAELEATLRAFFTPGERAYPTPYGKPDSQYPRCQFPARWIWLQQKLAIDPSLLPSADCTRFLKFKNRLAAQSVTLVFSSYFLNSPSSAFGHSLLRINKGSPSDRDRHELLDHGINFAAEVTTDNSLVYAIFGLAGGFKGTYSNVPYYYKVREYNDFEARDLWSYDLNLTRDEIDLLVAHLWELGGTYFDYYYFTQNCSYQILTALEAAAPRYKITDGLPPLYVIPSDTVREIMKAPGLVTGISYRPSVRSQFFYRLKNLSEMEKGLTRKLAMERALPTGFETLDTSSQVKVLDTAIDYLDYKYPKEKPESPTAAWKQQLLTARSQIPTKSEQLEIKPSAEQMPHSGHASSRFGMEFGSEEGQGSFAQLKMRFALHDTLDPGAGYPENSQIEFLNIQGRVFQSNTRVELEDLALLRILSLNPLADFNKGISWRVELGTHRVRDGNCDRCLATSFEGGAGWTVKPVASLPLSVFTLLEGDLSYSSSFFEGKFRPGVGPSLGILGGSERLRGIFKGGYRYEAFSAVHDVFQATGELRLNLTPSLSLGARGAAYKISQEAGVAAYLYF